MLVTKHKEDVGHYTSVTAFLRIACEFRAFVIVTCTLNFICFFEVKIWL